MKINIIQEEFSNDPWKVLVCCILLNQTSNKQVRPLIKSFFQKWPDAQSLVSSDHSEISQFIKTTGFQNIKSKRLKDFSNSWISGVRDPYKFPGIGGYGREAWRIFIEKDKGFIPKDKKLKMYVLDNI